MFNWRDFALCKGIKDPNIFFPESSKRTYLPKSICKRCPVQLNCLEEALRDKNCMGIWGGTTDYERRKLLRKRGEYS